MVKRRPCHGKIPFCIKHYSSLPILYTSSEWGYFRLGSHQLIFPCSLQKRRTLFLKWVPMEHVHINAFLVPLFLERAKNFFRCKMGLFLV